jgi:hypothetical protein
MGTSEKGIAHTQMTLSTMFSVDLRRTAAVWASVRQDDEVRITTGTVSAYSSIASLFQGLFVEKADSGEVVFRGEEVNDDGTGDSGDGSDVEEWPGFSDTDPVVDDAG